jgi:lipopolysaccharide/colanic/teichoic acid biosynthesis glycosyltransferase
MAIGKRTDGLTEHSPWCSYKNRAGHGPRPLVLNPIFIKQIPVWKRAFDIVGSLCGLIMLCPLFLVIGIFIKTVSPGPIFFKQKRVGCGGTLFNLYKFRTMKLNADATLHRQYLMKLIASSKASSNPGDPMEKLPADPRIIPYGRFLRRSGLDELPQLINVLRGQMSLVGPRPPIPYEVEQYKLWHTGRFDVMPGLTGLWQISGKNKLGFNEMIRFDIQYAMKRSLLLDLKILLKTPYVVYLQLKEMKKGQDQP